MSTVTTQRPGPRGRRLGARLPAWLLEVAPVAVIVAGVIVLLADYTLHHSIGGNDITTYFMPAHCFLGDQLSAGSIPEWNPFTGAGTPFAADPQSG